MGKVLIALPGKDSFSSHWLSCNNSLPEALPALSEEPKRASIRWDQPVAVSEGFDPSSSPGITKELNSPSLLHSHWAQ